MRAFLCGKRIDLFSIYVTKGRLQQNQTQRRTSLVLRALGAYVAHTFKVSLKPTAVDLLTVEENKQRADKYRSLLTIEGTLLPDPLTNLQNEWVGEARGLSLWPPCMFGDRAEYLVDSGEIDLKTRLLTTKRGRHSPTSIQSG